MQTDAILSSARSCHLHCHQAARVQVCWGEEAGAGGGRRRGRGGKDWGCMHKF